MTREQLQQLIAAWAARLGLSGWRIAFVVEDTSDENHTVMMSVERHDHYNDAVFYVHPYVVGEDKAPDCVENHIADQFGAAGMYERKVVHELLHLIARDVTVVAYNLAEHAGREAFDGFEAAWHHAEEATVDNLAAALVANWGSAA